MFDLLLNKHLPFRIKSGTAESWNEQKQEGLAAVVSFVSLFSLWILNLSVSKVFLRAAALRWWPRSPFILGVTHIGVCLGGSSSKDPGLRRQAGHAQYAGVSPALEKSSQRPDFFRLLPHIPQIFRSYSPDPLSEPVCEGTSLTIVKLEQVFQSPAP